jgi:RNAse (barnase) inhibitor barstar
VIEIDGLTLDTLDGFYDAFGVAALGSTQYGRNLDAFNDVLRGGFGSPDGGFILRWTNSSSARERLGYAETVRYIQRKLTRHHSTNVDSVQKDLELAMRGEGDTLFDLIVAIIRVHGHGGAESEDGVELEFA